MRTCNLLTRLLIAAFAVTVVIGRPNDSRVSKDDEVNVEDVDMHFDSFDNIHVIQTRSIERTSGEDFSGKTAMDYQDEIMHPYLPEAARRTPSTRSNRRMANLGNEKTSTYWNEDAQSALRKKINQKENRNKAKNIIMFLGDGMSVPTLMAARTYLGQLQGRNGEEEGLYWEKFPYAGFSKTYCVNAQVADSACTSTAYLCGVKTNSGMLGLNANVARRDCEASRNSSDRLTSIAEWALDEGMSAGIVTTARVTHASPGGAYAKSAERDWECDTDLIRDGVDPNVCKDIATQLVTERPGKDFQVILGGGRREFLPNSTVDDEGTHGKRSDDVDLIESWKQDKVDRNKPYRYVWNRRGLRNVIDDPEGTDYLLGLFEASHCQYAKEASPDSEPTLEEMTEAAIKILEKNENGYFLFVEGGRIDHAHHQNYAQLALHETVEMAAAVRKADELTDESDTLIVVTSDHAHVMSVAGYPTRGNDILGLGTSLADDDLPYATLSYANGPGYKKPVDNGRYDLSYDDLSETRYRFPGMVPRDSETHGGDDVGIFARGPWSHLFSGTLEQNSIPHFMAYAGCIGNGITACTGQT